MPESQALGEWGSLHTLPQDEKNYDWCSIKYLPSVFFEKLPDCELLHDYNHTLRTIRKGYAPEKNFFFDENGKPVSFESAKKKGLTPINELIYENQRLF